jgi:hypothetical protein
VKNSFRTLPYLSSTDNVEGSSIVVPLTVYVSDILYIYKSHIFKLKHESFWVNSQSEFKVNMNHYGFKK